MRRDEQLDALSAIDKFNEKLFKKYGGNGPSLTLAINNDLLFIFLSSLPYQLEFCLFNSLEDDRIYYEKSNKFESWEKFIKRKFLVIKEELNSIKL